MITQSLLVSKTGKSELFPCHWRKCLAFHVYTVILKEDWISRSD